jgi:hypothetical protein
MSHHRMPAGGVCVAELAVAPAVEEVDGVVEEVAVGVVGVLGAGVSDEVAGVGGEVGGVLRGFGSFPGVGGLVTAMSPSRSSSVVFSVVLWSSP